MRIVPFPDIHRQLIAIDPSDTRLRDRVLMHDVMFALEKSSLGFIMCKLPVAFNLHAEPTEGAVERAHIANLPTIFRVRGPAQKVPFLHVLQLLELPERSWQCMP